MSKISAQEKEVKTGSKLKYRLCFQECDKKVQKESNPYQTLALTIFVQKIDSRRGDLSTITGLKILDI